MILPLALVLLGGFARRDDPNPSQDPSATSDSTYKRARELADILGFADARERRSHAASLARTRDVTVEEWVRAVELAATLPPAPTGDIGPVPELRAKSRFPPGTFVKEPRFWVGGQPEDTSLCIYVPTSLDASHPAPLLMAFHGTSGRGEDIEPMWRATAEKLGMIVVAPSEAGKNEGYAFSERERRAALEALRWIRLGLDVDEDRIFATGISRGGHLAWDLALRHPDLIAAIAPMIGGPRFQLSAGQNNLRYLGNVAHLPIRDLQGALDDPGLVANVRLAFERLGKLNALDARLLEFPELGHSFDFGAVDWVAFFGAAKRNPIPDRVVRLAARTDEARAFWVEITKLGKDVTEDVAAKVTASTWKALDEDGKRRYLEGEVEKRTARLEVKRTGPGRFAATGERVLAFRLLISAEMFDPSKPVQVLFNGKFIEKKARPDARVLLEEFVERFDRRFLPVAAVEVP